MNYQISVYLDGYPGFFRYEVETKDQAMQHFAAITDSGYRRINDRGHLEWHSPKSIRLIKIEGDGLETKYQDTFYRT